MTTDGFTPERMRAELAELLEVPIDEVVEGINLLDLGLDSLRVMELVERWSAASGVALGFPDLAETPELGRWQSLIFGPDA